MLIAEILELGTVENGQVAALAGVAPVTKQLGKSQGKSFIRDSGCMSGMPCTCLLWLPCGTTLIFEASISACR